MSDDTVKGKERLFRFKQFEVSHSLAAMKVGTDGVMLGAWAPIDDACRMVWDVGGGSGLIALMIAQRCAAAEVISIEIEQEAIEEMESNFLRSPWAARLTAVEGDVNEVAKDLPPADLIVSNPPFFVNSIAAPDHARSIARHESVLSYGSLIEISAGHLTPTGRLAMVSPADRREDIEWCAAVHRLNVLRRVDVSTVDGKTPRRILWLLGRGSAESIISTESIRNADGTYTPWYVNLTREFYTHLK